MQANVTTEEDIIPPKLYKRGIPRKAVLAFSTVFPLTSTVIHSLLTYRAAKLIWDSDIFAGSVMALTIPASFTLSTYVNYSIVGNIFDKIYDTSKRRKNRTVLYSFCPATIYLVPILALTFTALSIGDDIFLNEDSLKDSPFSEQKWLLTGVVATSIAQLDIHAMMDLFVNLGTYVLSRTKKARDVVNFIQWLNIFSNLFAEADENMKSDFISDFVPAEAVSMDQKKRASDE